MPKDKKISSSPVPSKILIDFSAAVAKIIGGAKVSKVEWKNPGIYIYLKDGWLMINKDDGDHQLLISEGDLIGKDFFVL